MSGTSRINREVYVRFCERLGVRHPGPTRHLRGNKLSHTLWDTYDAIVQACAEAWRFLIGDPNRLRSIATRSWACVNV